MPFLGVNVAVLQQDKILLTLREDFEVWCLPGGAVDDGESLAQAAIREVREETGLEVELTRLVGVFSQPSGPHGGAHLVVFAAQPIGGQVSPSREEVIDIGFFEYQRLPELLFQNTGCIIKDVFEGVGGGAAWSCRVGWPFEKGITRWDVYRMRDESGLSRSDFYLKYFTGYTEKEDVREVPPMSSER